MYEKLLSSTWRELTAIYFSLKSFKSYFVKNEVLLRTDSYASSRIVKVGSNKNDLQELALSIYQFCKREQNERADTLSKFNDTDDWEISKCLFNKLNSLWGPYTFDRFANTYNKKVKKFNSKFLCPEHTE